MAIEVTLIGLDGSGKSSNISLCAKLLGKDYPVVLMGWKSIGYILKEKICYLSRKKQEDRPDCFDKLRFFPNRVKTTWYRLRKASLLARLQPVFCFEDRDLLLDPSIVVVSYLPVISKAPISTRVRFMQRITRGRLSDVYIYLDVSPETAYERVHLRHLQEGKKLSAHENLQHLHLLHSQYEKGLTFLERSHIPIYRVNTEILTLEECSQEIIDFLKHMYCRGKRTAFCEQQAKK